MLPLFVFDPALWGPAGGPRKAWLLRSLRALSAAMDGALVVRHGDPAVVVPQVADELGAGSVHVSADAGVYGRRRDVEVERALGSRPLVRTGTPYAVGPGTIVKSDGTPYSVFTPFFRAWSAHGYPPPAGPPPADLRWAELPSEALPDEPDLPGLELPAVGEQAALERWRAFAAEALPDYGTDRNRPDLEGTSSLSAHLKYGEIHPRTLLADLGSHISAGRNTKGAETFTSELAWRDFYADVLWHQPESARTELKQSFAAMRHDEPGALFDAWREGRTGFPFVDAGMRQLRGAGWVHNRVRMVVASFLVKDLHVQWQHGSRHFMRWLRDGDLASNNHGWQWVAGSGTDAAPYFRVFNPVTQGQNFDPDGAYVRRWVPELRHLPGASAHEPWASPDGYAHGYPQRIVDHAAERREALARYSEISG